MNAPTILDEALRHAAEGFEVFPLVSFKGDGSKSDGKKPAVKWKAEASKDPAQLRKWFGPGGRHARGGLALRTGATRTNPDTGAAEWLAVIDVDMASHGKDGLGALKAACTAKGLRLEDFATRLQHTAGGGWHALYWSPVPLKDGPDALGKGSGVDVKSDSYIVAAPTKIGDTAYRWEDPAAPIAHLGALASLFTTGTPRTATTDRTPLPGVDPARALQRGIDYLAAAPRSVKGAGGDQCAYTVAAQLLALGMDEPAALDLLLSEHWEHGCGWSADRLAEKVRNAARYMLNPPGSDAPEAQFEPVEVDQAAAPAKENPFKPLRLSDLRNLPWPEWTVHELIPAKGMGLIFGPSKSGKTFLALDIAGACVRGIPWAGLSTKQGIVVYVGLEGQARTRVAAYAKKHGLTDAQLDDLIIFEQPPLNLLDASAKNSSVIQLIDAVRSVASDRPILLTIIDTLAQATPGGDENGSLMMSAAVGSAKRIGRALGGTVVLCHHTGKDLAAGARGHSSLTAAADFEIAVSRPGEGIIRGARVAKVKDAEDGTEWTFQLEVVPLGMSPDGQLRTSCVVAQLTPGKAGAASAIQEPLTALQQVARDALVTAFDAACGVDPDFEGRVTCTRTAWRDAYYLLVPANDKDARERRRKNFEGAVKALLEKGHAVAVPKGGRNVYRVGTPK